MLFLLYFNTPIVRSYKHFERLYNTSFRIENHLCVNKFSLLKNNKMPDTKKTQHNDNKSAKSSKEEMNKGNSSKPMNNNSNSKNDTKADKKTSSSHSK